MEGFHCIPEFIFLRSKGSGGGGGTSFWGGSKRGVGGHTYM